MKNKDEYYMKLALEQAKIAYDKLEVPIGAVLVVDDTVISSSYNNNRTFNNPLCHAEIMVINEASKKLSKHRLTDATLYISLEPCAMCAGAIIQARIKRVVIAAKDKKRGCAGSVMNLLDCKDFNHRVIVEHGVLENESSTMLSDFFKNIRKTKI